MLQCSSSELFSYAKDVFINGEKIDDELSVVIYEDNIYFSVDLLCNYISDNFISQCGSSISIRRNEIEPLALLQSEYGIYIRLDFLKQYVHINNDVYKSCGSIYMDSMLSASVNINGVKYYLTNEKLSALNSENNLTKEVLSDGRRAWIDGDNLYVEDDWGNIYRYRKSQVNLYR